MPITCSDCPKFCCACLCPPIGVFCEVGCNATLVINIILTLLFYFPGLLYACWVICDE